MNEFRQDDPVAANKKISSPDFTPLYESTAVDVTCYMSEANMKEEAKAHHSADLSALNEKSSIETDQNWLNSSMMSSPRAGYVEVFTKVSSVSSINSDSSSQSSSSSAASSVSPAETNSTHEMHRNTTTVNAMSSEYKLEVYKDYDDISDDYTKYTRQMLTPLPLQQHRDR